MKATCVTEDVRSPNPIALVIAAASLWIVALGFATWLCCMGAAEVIARCGQADKDDICVACFVLAEEEPDAQANVPAEDDGTLTLSATDPWAGGGISFGSTTEGYSIISLADTLSIGSTGGGSISIGGSPLVLCADCSAWVSGDHACRAKAGE